MKARIFRPAKTAMQSGKGNTRLWLLEFEADAAKRPDPLMGWAGGASTQSQVRLKFDSCDAAIAYADKHGLAYEVLPDQPRALKLQSYADNFR
ncbi:ETC complex I subunit [Parapedomonas caeni]|jgi:hypothetical protein